MSLDVFGEHVHVSTVAVQVVSYQGTHVVSTGPDASELGVDNLQGDRPTMPTVVVNRVHHAMIATRLCRLTQSVSLAFAFVLKTIIAFDDVIIMQTFSTSPSII